jgi:hypothetical protein
MKYYRTYLHELAKRIMSDRIVPHYKNKIQEEDVLRGWK